MAEEAGQRIDQRGGDAYDAGARMDHAATAGRTMSNVLGAARIPFALAAAGQQHPEEPDEHEGGFAEEEEAAFEDVPVGGEEGGDEEGEPVGGGGGAGEFLAVGGGEFLQEGFGEEERGEGGQAEEGGVERVGVEDGFAEEGPPGGEEQREAGGIEGIAADLGRGGDAVAVEEVVGHEEVGEFIGCDHGFAVEVPLAAVVFVDEGEEGEQREESSRRRD